MPQIKRIRNFFLVIAFHRTLSSSLACWLHHAGLNMGYSLMPPAISNPYGHYEDISLVDMHDQQLRRSGTDWRCTDSKEPDYNLRIDLLKIYALRRSDTVDGPLGAKDPRACLFLPAWRQVLGDEGRYVVLLRHWSGSVQSLYRRHGEALAVGEGGNDLNASFWEQPELAARMWLAYHRRLIPLLEESRDQCLVVTQQALLGGLPIIEKLNTRFGLGLDSTTPSPIRHSLSHDLIEESVTERLPAALVNELEVMWQRLLACADYHGDNDAPKWVKDHDAAPMVTQALLRLADKQDSIEPVVISGMPPSSLQQQLKELVEDTSQTLDVMHWQRRIEQEQRFIPECWELLARAQLARGDALGAEQNLSKVFLCGKSPPYLYLLLGTCREAELDDEGAEHFYRLAIARNDANATFHVRLARLWLTQGDYAKAENHLLSVIGHHPGKPPLIHALANCLDQQNRTQEAIELLQNSLNEGSGSIPMLANQLFTLQLKLNPEGTDEMRSAHMRAAASRIEVQEAAVSALARVTNPAARYDLARRIATTWQKLEVELVLPPFQ